MYATSNANDCVGIFKYRCCKSNFVIQNKTQTPYTFLSPQRFQSRVRFHVSTDNLKPDYPNPKPSHLRSPLRALALCKHTVNQAREPIQQKENLKKQKKKKRETQNQPTKTLNQSNPIIFQQFSLQNSLLTLPNTSTEWARTHREEDGREGSEHGHKGTSCSDPGCDVALCCVTT